MSLRQVGTTCSTAAWLYAYLPMLICSLSVDFQKFDLCNIHLVCPSPEIRTIDLFSWRQTRTQRTPEFHLSIDPTQYRQFPRILTNMDPSNTNPTGDSLQQTLMPIVTEL